MSKTVMCAARLPELLVARIDAAAKSCGASRAQFIAEACRLRLDGPVPRKVVSVGWVQPPDSLPPLPYVQVESTDYPGLERSKVPSQSLRDICAGNLPKGSTGFAVHDSLDHPPIMEVAICGKDWWEDGEHYECLMDAGLHAKHGLRGMVRRLDD